MITSSVRSTSLKSRAVDGYYKGKIAALMVMMVAEYLKERLK